MFSVSLFFLLLMPAFGQRVTGSQPSPTPLPQPAQTISINLSSDLATALEALRLSVRTPPITDTSGVTITRPVYPDIKSMLKVLLAGPGGVFRSLLVRYPSDAGKTARSEKELQDIIDKALEPTLQ